MTKDAIIREWFYRLPKGYANAPYTKEEMDVLHEVLEENELNGSVFVNENSGFYKVDPGPKRWFKKYGDKYTEYEKATNPSLKEVDQLDQAFHDAKPVDDKEKKHTLSEEWIWEETAEDLEERVLTEQDDVPVPTVAELAALLSSTKQKYSDKVLKRVGELLSIDTISNEVVEKEMIEIMAGDASHVDDILDIVMRPGTDQPKFAAYMQNRTVPYTKFMNKAESLVDTFEDATGLSKNAIQRLAMYKWPSMPAIGPIEVLLALLLKGGQRPSGDESGDLRVNKKPFEVKGFSARLKGQKGFGSPSGVRKAFISAYNNLVTDIAPKEQSAWGSGSWLTTLESLNKQVIPTVGYDAAIKAMQDGFMAAYANMTVNELEWIKSYVCQNGEIDRGGFIRALAEAAFDYYVGVEDIDIFTVTNATLAKGGPAIANAKVLMFKPSQFPSYLGSQIGIVMPSYADSAGPQGVAFGLKLGTKTKALT